MRRRSALVLVALPLAGCATTVPVEVAPYAHHPLCAEVVLALPDVLGDLERQRTSSQGAVAWGTEDPVVLRCGVEPPPPTTDPCVTADDGRTAVDWVAVEQPGDEGSAWTFTTYGREPAVEVVVPASVASTRSTSFLMDLGPAIEKVEQTRRCL